MSGLKRPPQGVPRRFEIRFRGDDSAEIMSLSRVRSPGSKAPFRWSVIALVNQFFGGRCRGKSRVTTVLSAGSNVPRGSTW